MRNTPELPPGYKYSRDGRRISIRHLKSGDPDSHTAVYQSLPGFWYKDGNAAKAAWKHYEAGLEGIDAQDALDVFLSPNEIITDSRLLFE